MDPVDSKAVELAILNRRFVRALDKVEEISNQYNNLGYEDFSEQLNEIVHSLQNPLFIETDINELRKLLKKS